MQRYGLIGHPLKHSMSRHLFNEKFEYEGLDCLYQHFDLKSLDELHAIMEKYPDLSATPLGQIAQGTTPDTCICDMILGFIPGSIGETSVIAIAIGAIILLWMGIASWRTMLSVFVGGAAMGVLFESTGVTTMPWWHHFILGGFAFGAVFMATDPVTSCRTECGKYFYGFIIGAMAVIIRVKNAGYPEGMMLARMTPPTTAITLFLKSMSKKLAARVPVQAPVPGNGMPTKSSKAQ